MTGTELVHVIRGRMELVTLPASDQGLAEFLQYMTTARLSPATIRSRMEILTRLSTFLGRPLLTATIDDLVAWQRTYRHLARATDDIYTRHVRAFYAWAVEFEHLDKDPSRRMVAVKVHKGLPHPTKATDLQVIFACVTGHLRTAYTLAAFAGLRCGEICRLRWDDITEDGQVPTAFIQGKGGKERIVPMLRPVMDELWSQPHSGRGHLITDTAGRPYRPNHLSADSSRYLTSLGLPTTLHSMRHAFATSAVRLTRDPLFVRDLLGHSSVATTEIYMQTSLDGAHDRLSGLATDAMSLLLNIKETLHV